MEKILPEVISVIKLLKNNLIKYSVIAAGGIYTGADIYKFIQMGAQREYKWLLDLLQLMNAMLL